MGERLVAWGRVAARPRRAQRPASGAGPGRMRSVTSGRHVLRAARGWRRVRVAAVGRELLLVAAAALVYGVVRELTEGSVPQAIANGRRLYRLEERLGVAWEDELQAPLLMHEVVATIANWVYVWGHWPVIAVAAVLLYRRRRPAYRLLRNAMFLSGGIGFAFFALLPMAPPRLAQLGLVDTVTAWSTSYRALQPPELTNLYAAFPSLHFGWNLLVGVVLWREAQQLWLRGFAVVMPSAMAFSVVATGNHYVLDVAGAAAVVLAGLVLALRLDAARVATLAGGGERTIDGAVRRRAPGGERPPQPAGR